MGIVTLVILGLGGVAFAWMLYQKPEVIAVLFFTITIADINFDMPGIPVNFRAIVGVALFLRTLALPRDEYSSSFFFNPYVQLVLIFLLYAALVTAFNDLIVAEYVKATALTVISVYCGYYYFFMKGNNGRYLKIALFISGVIAVGDLAYTYGVIGEFPVQRIYLFLLNKPVETDETGKAIEVINHNFYGMICGMCFVYLLNDFLNNRASGAIMALLPVMFLGVLMSTSRSSLMAIVVISLILLSREVKSREKAKQVYKALTMLVAVLVFGLLLFISLQDYIKLKSEFMESITLRLIDEPIAVLNKHLGNNYDVRQLDAMDWRAESAANAFDKFMQFSSAEQTFGIGIGGFLDRDLGKGLNPHNGTLLLVIEHGIIGLVLYVLIVFLIIRRSLQAPQLSSLLPAVIFVILYCLGQNGELTNSSTFLIYISLIAEHEYMSNQPPPTVS